MFDRIAHTYDDVNHIISLGQDRRWRKKVALRLNDHKELYLLDLATGTGEQIVCRHIMPLFGGSLFGDFGAYRYLNRSVESFPDHQTMCAKMKSAGFEAITAQPLMSGVATIYEGYRSRPDHRLKSISHSTSSENRYVPL